MFCCWISEMLRCRELAYPYTKFIRSDIRRTPGMASIPYPDSLFNAPIKERPITTSSNPQRPLRKIAFKTSYHQPICPYESTFGIPLSGIQGQRPTPQKVQVPTCHQTHTMQSDHTSRCTWKERPGHSGCERAGLRAMGWVSYERGGEMGGMGETDGMVDWKKQDRFGLVGDGLNYQVDRIDWICYICR